MKPSPEQLDMLWPQRHEIAERIGLNAALRPTFIPFTPQMTTEQRDVIFPPTRRIPVMRELVAMIDKTESQAS